MKLLSARTNKKQMERGLFRAIYFLTTQHNVFRCMHKPVEITSSALNDSQQLPILNESRQDKEHRADKETDARIDGYREIAIFTSQGTADRCPCKGPMDDQHEHGTRGKGSYEREAEAITNPIAVPIVAGVAT
jgi:hypothetical protein